MTTTRHEDGTISTVHTDAATREGLTARAGQINDTYSLAGADLSKEQAAQVAIASLSAWDLAEMQKVYGVQDREELLAVMQRSEEAAAADRSRRLVEDERRRAEIVGGLAISGPLDVTSETDLDQLATEVKLGLPWHLRHTGPNGNGVTVVRKKWTAREAGRAAKVLGWEVRTEPAGWTTRTGETSKEADDNYRVIVRRAIEEYAADCRCAGYHMRPLEERQTTRTEDGREILQPLCAWLTEKALGVCRSGWKADVQMEDLIDVLATFTETGRVVPDSIGWLQGGSRTFIQMRMAETFYVLKEDAWHGYLGIHQAYTGKDSASIHHSHVRTACDNTRREAERLATAIARIAHTGRMAEAFAEAGRYLLEAEGYVTRQQQTAERLAKIDLSIDDYHTIADALIEDNSTTERQATNARNRRLELAAHLLTDETLPPDLRRTGYGAREAVNRWYGQLAPSLDRTDTARLYSVWDSAGSAVEATRKVTRIVQTIGGRRVKATVGRKVK
jgi:hypothetical protein